MSAAIDDPPRPDEPPRPPLEPGEMLAGRYRIERTVGSGGMGVVFAATHVELEQAVAIKVLLPEALRAPGAKDRFLREARTVARMKTEHVARVYDAGSLASGQPYAVMEFLEGQDLSKVLEARGPLSVEEAVALLLQTCEALAEAHQLGIVHRDLKPENMFVTTGVDKRPFVKIIDFGLAKSLSPAGKEGKGDNLTTSFTVMGTPLYMSPEQLRSTRDVDHRSDIWSLGVVAYEMLAGRAPFDGEALADLCATIVRDPAPKMGKSNVPSDLEASVLRCLEKEPSARFTKIAHFAAAIANYAHEDERAILDKILRVQPMSAPPPRRLSDPNLGIAPLKAEPTSEPVIPIAAPAPRRGIPLAAIAGGGLLLGLIAVSLVVRSGRDKSDSPAPTGLVARESPTTMPSASPAPTEIAPAVATAPPPSSAPTAIAAASTAARPSTPPTPKTAAVIQPTPRTTVAAPRPSAKPTKDPLETR
jgi:serine/threonine-protein kinase